MDINETPFWYDFDNFKTLDAAIEAATKTARRRYEPQTIYKANTIVALAEPTTPVVITTL